MPRYDGLTPVAGSLVTVYEQGTLDPATLFADDLDTPLGNPFTSDDRTGVYSFWAALANYDIVVGTVGDPSIREPALPEVIFSGTSPTRSATLVVDDPEEGQIVMAQVMY